MGLGAVGRVCVVLVRGAVVLDEGVVMGCGVLIRFEDVVLGRDVAVHTDGVVFGCDNVVVVRDLVVVVWCAFVEAVGIFDGKEMSAFLWVIWDVFWGNWFELRVTYDVRDFWT